MSFKSAVITFPGSNCDRDALTYLKDLTHGEVFNIWHEESSLPNVDLVILPGGFSFGDYLRSGAMASKSNIIHDVIDHANNGRYLLGICNGFQILTETGLLPGILQQNKFLNFICKNIFIKIKNKENKYFKNIKKEILELHIAHNEGNYFCSEDELKSLINNNQIAVTYCNENGKEADHYNPNGALSNIAGIFNKNKNILGMMPHPERVIDKSLSSDDGNFFFENLIENLK